MNPEIRKALKATGFSFDSLYPHERERDCAAAHLRRWLLTEQDCAVEYSQDEIAVRFPQNWRDSIYGEELPTLARAVLAVKGAAHEA